MVTASARSNPTRAQGSDSGSLALSFDEIKARIRAAAHSKPTGFPITSESGILRAKLYESSSSTARASFIERVVLHQRLVTHSAFVFSCVHASAAFLTHYVRDATADVSPSGSAGRP